MLTPTIAPQPLPPTTNEQIRQVPFDQLLLRDAITQGCPLPDTESGNTLLHSTTRILETIVTILSDEYEFLTFTKVSQNQKVIHLIPKLMTTFIFPFVFLESNYKASCHVIYPPPDKQYHITVYDEHLRHRYGDVQMVIEKGEEWNWGIPPQPKGSEFMAALVMGLKEQLVQHLEG